MREDLARQQQRMLEQMGICLPDRTEGREAVEADFTVEEVPRKPKRSQYGMTRYS